MFSYKKYHLMKTIQLKTAMALCFGHKTRIDQSESFKTNCLCDPQGKYKLTNQKPGNFAHVFLP